MGSFGGYSLVCIGVSPLHALLWDFHGLGHRWRSTSEWLSHLSTGCDCGDWEKETAAFLDTEARGSSVCVNGFDSWSWNAASLIVWSMGLLWDIWPPQPPEGLLKETRLISSSIPYFVRWV